MTNQILCVCADATVPGVYPCVIQGEHLTTCTGYNGRGEECGGCAPRSAERGYLCQRHYDDVEHAYARWPEWRSQVTLAGERAVQKETGGGGQALGFVPFPGWMLSADECDRLIASLHRMPKPSLQLWVHSESGARDAIQFARAAVRAYRDHEVRERPHKVPTVRCPSCEQKTLVWLPPAYFPSEVTVSCQNDACRRDLTQSAFEVIADIESRRKRA